MKKRISLFVFTALMSLSFSTLSFAGEWKNDTTGWWYVNDNNTYPVNHWVWIDGNNDGIAECYFFNATGYMVANTTVDNCIINENGAWVVNGVVQTKQISIEENADEADEVYKDKKNDKAVNDKNSNDSFMTDEDLEKWFNENPDINKGELSSEDFNWN